ncbi:BTB/POZ domain-containing protein 6-like [Mya arenaria]|uniref:BTB/POZ domain-containing protein 6-like n=1 Tax=Mya arenaria TaxID=6604 RepID=UPI0022E4AF92|nr:BTB/POZ domain-containing protein 6-like [Mya arenaria]
MSRNNSFYTPRSKPEVQNSFRKPTGRPPTNKSNKTTKSVGFRLDHDWQSEKTQGQCLNEMLQHEVLADVEFVVGGGKKTEVIKAHKVILASRSAAFFTMFMRDERKDCGQIIVDDIEPTAFKTILRYIYTDQAEVTTKTATALLHAARKYQLGALTRLCSQKLAAGVATDTVCALLEQAHHFRDEELKKTCLNYIYENANAVLTSPEFEKICDRCLATVLAADELRADESVVYKAAVTWATKACKKQRLPVNGDNLNRVLGNNKFLIRFPVLDIDFFSKNVANQGLLSKDETIAVFQYLHSRTSPNVANFITRRRAMTRAYRFDITSGAWNVGNYYCDAIQFQCSNQVVLDGVVVYSCYVGEASYDVSVRVLSEKLELIIKHDVTIETMSQVETYDVLFHNGLTLKPMTWYTIALYMDGPQTKRGVCGKSMVYCEKVQFFFKTSIVAQNCTTEREGQIPGIIFH